MSIIILPRHQLICSIVCLVYNIRGVESSTTRDDSFNANRIVQCGSLMLFVEWAGSFNHRAQALPVYGKGHFFRIQNF